MEYIVAEGDLVQFGLTLGVTEGEIGDGGILGGNHIHGGEGNGLPGERIQYRDRDFTHPVLEHVVVYDKNLRPGRNDEPEQQEYNRE